MRSKEEAEDYRYFAEPDLLPLVIDPARVDELRLTLPELPEQKRARFVLEFSLPWYDAAVLSSSRALAEFFEKSAGILSSRGLDGKAAGKSTANLLIGEVTRLLNEENIVIGESKLVPEHIADVVQLLEEKAVSSTGAKAAISAAWKSGHAIGTIVERDGLRQVSDSAVLEPFVEKVIAAFPDQVAEYKAGKVKVLSFFIGQIMKQTGGKANPALIQELIKKKLS